MKTVSPKIPLSSAKTTTMTAPDAGRADFQKTRGNTMPRLASASIATLMVMSLASCISPQGRPDYTASGALAGGATGAVIGSLAKHSGPGGALVGAAVGAVVGGLIGHELDRDQEARLKAQAPEVLQRIEQSQPLTIQDVQELANAGIGDELILSLIRNTRTVYYLTTADIIVLKNAGVSERVIDHMINTPSQAQSTQVTSVVGATPPAPLSEPVPVRPGPGYIWVNGTWLWLTDHWAWSPGYWHRPPGRHYRHR